MIEPRQDVCLTGEPLGPGAAAIGDVEHLDGDVALQHVIARDVNGAHAAMSRHAADLVARIQLRPGRGLAQSIDRAIRDHVRLPGALRLPLPTPLRSR
jgi:hypothetical protein